MGAGQNIGGLLELAGVGERFAIGGEHLHVFGILNGETLQHRHRLRVLPQRMKRSGVGQRRVFVGAIGVVATAPVLAEAMQRRLIPGQRDRRSGFAKRVGHAGHTGFAAAQRKSQHKQAGCETHAPLRSCVI